MIHKLALLFTLLFSCLHTAVGSPITNPLYCPYKSVEDIQHNTAQLPSAAGKYYQKHLDYPTTKGKSIRLLAQEEVSDSQLLYAYAILHFYLSHLPADIAEHMAQQKATLILPRGAHHQSKLPEKALIGQELYQDEIANIGSDWYLKNNYRHRDATLEEVFHLVHDFGIGTSQNPQKSPPMAQCIARATQEALPEKRSLWGKSGRWGLGDEEWLSELEEEESLEQEYFVSVLDSYYGLWEAWTEDEGGMWGCYIAKTRAEVQIKDPQGYAMIQSILPPFIDTIMPLDSNFEGTFYMQRNPAIPYTAKSQYLQHLMLQGEKDANIEGNEQNNILMGNAGTNHIDGKSGSNTLQLRGPKSDYYVQKQDNGCLHIQDSQAKRDGIIYTRNIHTLRFTDCDKRNPQ